MRAARSAQRWSRLVLGGAVALVSVACHKAHPEGTEPLAKRQADGSLALDERALSYVRIEAAQPVTESRSRTLAARISFDERNMSRIGPPVQGRVSAVNVVTGDKVQKNAVLLTIDAPDIASAQAQVAQARNARLLAEQGFARAQRLSQEGAGSQAEMERAQSALEQARSEEQRAVATLNAIGGAHGAAGYQLRAPLSGSVVERNVAVGSQVSTGQDQPLFVIADLSTVWVLGDVYEEDLARVRVGDEATVRVLAYPDKRFAGKLTYLGETVDPLTRRRALVSSWKTRPASCGPACSRWWSSRASRGARPTCRPARSSPGATSSSCS
jgi:cobalt-zinc-cadmium efflux system membrane fusion protein